MAGGKKKDKAECQGTTHGRWMQGRTRSKLVMRMVEANKQAYQQEEESEHGASDDTGRTGTRSASPKHDGAAGDPTDSPDGSHSELGESLLHRQAIEYLERVRRKIGNEDIARPKKDFLSQRLRALIRHGDRRVSAYFLFNRAVYEGLVRRSRKLPSRSLHVEEQGQYLLHQPSSNKRRQPQRLVPCADEWMDLVERADKELQHPNDPERLHRYLLTKGFAKPPLLACQLWVQHCRSCERKNEDGRTALDDLELMTKQEVVELLRCQNGESPS